MNLKSLIKVALPWVNVDRFLRWTGRMYSDRPLFIFEGRTYTYRDTLAQGARYAHLFRTVREARIAEGRLDPKDPLPVGIYQDNSPEFIFAYFGAALSGSMLFGVNTGFRGEMLEAVVNQARMQLILVEQDHVERFTQILDRLETIDADRILVTGEDPAKGGEGPRPVAAALEDLETRLGQAIERPPGAKVGMWDALLVIYTSGTTGAPKAVPCSHFKMAAVGAVGAFKVGLRGKDRGYVSMPLFHSNAWFVGIMPLLGVGASFLLKRKFSASAFEDDILEHGVTFMNYVGQPVHYILSALEKKHGSPEKVEAALAKHPKNRFRIAYGNGASGLDRRRMMTWLGMEHIYELYGATEAAVTTINMPGDPIDSVGRVGSKHVQILDENDRPCPPGIADEEGRLTNYEEAVGEICRKIARDNIFFDGYYQNAGATDKKYRDGWYRSGDLGHIRVVDGKRYLYFNGRTDDWIRKDGENFSAENVAQHVSAHPDVELVAAYGVPCEVSDEKVMVAVQLREGAAFDPKGFFDFLTERQATGGMDPKWMPDYVRIVDPMPMTPTQKVIVRPLKREHFHVAKHPDFVVYHRRRGDDTFHRLTADAFAGVKKEFEKTERLELLEV